MDDETLRLFVKLLNGLSVPVSMGMPLGKAGEAYTEIREKFGLFGWQSDDEVLEIIKEKL